MKSFITFALRCLLIIVWYFFFFFGLKILPNFSLIVLSDFNLWFLCLLAFYFLEFVKPKY